MLTLFSDQTKAGCNKITIKLISLALSGTQINYKDKINIYNADLFLILLFLIIYSAKDVWLS